MKFQFWSVGKAHDAYVKEGITLFTRRIAGYFPVEWHLLPPLKNAAVLSETELRKKEGAVILETLSKDDYLVLLDERGKLTGNQAIASLIQTRANERTKNMIFLIGGAYGVSEEVRKRAQYTWSLSPLVFPHQLVRLMLAEQVYRTCTILRNEPYHHT